MKLEDFNYYLPKELIAQLPSERRDESHLMVLNRKEGTIQHKRFFELPEHLRAGDVLVLNDTKVIPARLFGKKKTGGLVEILLIQSLTSSISHEGRWKGERESQTWTCLISPARGIKKGSEITFEHKLKATIIEKGYDGEWLIELYADIGVDKVIELVGNMPLPPYIKRGHGAKGKGHLPQGKKISELDRERYQTIFAKEKGAIAAPTAGLHFTQELLNRIQNLDVEIFYITLHTGLGTFKPVKEEDIARHRMMPEYYNIDPAAFEAIKKAKKEKRRIVAVGSTATRALETMVKHGWERPRLSGYTNLFIYPGYKFNVVDALITNFHLPKSTLLMLVAAFAGRDFIMQAYEDAVRLHYRFFSYGDAMMIA